MQAIIKSWNLYCPCTKLSSLTKGRHVLYTYHYDRKAVLFHFTTLDSLIFSGDRCEHETNECQSSPCQNSGFCVDHVDGYECLCLPAFTGTDCQTSEFTDEVALLTNPWLSIILLGGWGTRVRGAGGIEGGPVVQRKEMDGRLTAHNLSWCLMMLRGLFRIKLGEYKCNKKIVNYAFPRKLAKMAFIIILSRIII